MQVMSNPKPANQNKPFDATPEKSSSHKIITATAIIMVVRMGAAGTIYGFPYQTICLLLELNQNINQNRLTVFIGNPYLSAKIISGFAQPSYSLSRFFR
jgi:hypothetical protein